MFHIINQGLHLLEAIQYVKELCISQRTIFFNKNKNETKCALRKSVQ